MKEGQRKGGTGNEVEYREGKTWKNRGREGWIKERRNGKRRSEKKCKENKERATKKENIQEHRKKERERREIISKNLSAVFHISFLFPM